MCGYMPIIDVYAREILDSAGNPAIEVEIMTEDGTVGRAAVPSDVSGDGHGAVPPGDLGEGRRAVPPINVFAEEVGALDPCHLMNSALADVVIGENVYDQASIDRLLRRKSRNVDSLTRNAICCVSMAAAVTAAKSLYLPFYRYLGGICADRLPIPMVTLLYGARHKEKPGIERMIRSDAREFMIMPIGACTYEKGLRMCMEVCRVFWQLLAEQLFFSEDVSVSVGVRMDTKCVLSLILTAVKKAGYQPGREIALAIDLAADELYEEVSDSYVFQCEKKPNLGEIRKTTEEMIDWLESLCSSFPILSIVDGLSQKDREGWKKLARRLGARVRLVADSLFDADPKEFLDTNREQAANAVLIKQARFATLTDLLHTATLAKGNGYEVVFSYGESETWDPMIADLAVAVGGTQIRAGAPCRAESAAKYNRLLRIEDSLGLAAWNQGLV